MQGSRVRRPCRPSSWLVLSLLALLLPTAWGCDVPSHPSAGGTGSTEQAEKTRKMEEKAAEIDRKSEEVRNMQGTDQEKIDAMNSLDQERRELNAMDEGK
jgi:hypothetical protein